MVLKDMQSPRKVLFVEDDADFRDSLLDAFTLKGYDTAGAGSIEEFNKIILKNHFDLAFVDLNLPDGSGYAVTRTLRQSTDTRIIILTARETIGDRVEGYTHGADIYMVKPTSIAELLAASEAILRPREASELQNKIQPWKLDPSKQTLLAPNGISLNLSKRQSSFLKCIMEKPGTLVERSTIWNTISPNKNDSSGKALSMFVARLRKEIETETSLKIPIETVSGRGFMFQKR
jgi:two-component system OmpR family response regulator